MNAASTESLRAPAAPVSGRPRGLTALEVPVPEPFAAALLAPLLRRALVGLALLALAALCAAPAAAAGDLADAARRPHLAMPGDLPPLPEVPFVPTPEDVVDAMLRMAKTGKGDVVYDLGCGDGRIVVAAVEHHGAARGVCVEIDPDLLDLARVNARAAGVEGRIRFVEGDLFDVDLSPATVVTLYLLPEVNLRLRPKLLRELRPGSRVVSSTFDMGDWEPQETDRVQGKNLFLWTIPRRERERRP